MRGRVSIPRYKSCSGSWRPETGDRSDCIEIDHGGAKWVWQAFLSLRVIFGEKMGSLLKTFDISHPGLRISVRLIAAVRKIPEVGGQRSDVSDQVVQRGSSWSAVRAKESRPSAWKSYHTTYEKSFAYCAEQLGIADNQLLVGSRIRLPWKETQRQALDLRTQTVVRRYLMTDSFPAAEKCAVLVAVRTAVSP